MYTLNWQMEHTRVLQVGKNHQDWCDCLVAFFVSFDWFIFEWILVRNTHTQVTGSNIAVEPRTDLCPPQSLLYSSGLSLFASEGSGDEFAGFFNYIPKSIKSHSGITIAMPCLSFWTGTKSWVVPFPGTASQCCAHTSPEQLSLCFERDQRNIPSGWAASQTIKTCWKCFWKCLHWKETRLTSSSKQCCEQSGDVHGLHVNQPRSDHCAEVSSFPVKSELLPNDEEALVERNRSKVKHWGENSLEKKWAF